MTKNRMGPGSLECLPVDVLCQITKQLDFDDKLQLQLVSRKLHALLLKPPPGEYLWGECNLSVIFDESLGGRGYIDPSVRRWFVRRTPYMTRIICDTHATDGAQMLHTLVPSLSSLMAPAAELCIKLDTVRTRELLQCKAGQQPQAAMLDFWRTLSGRITALTIVVDWRQQQEMLLQPQLLSELSALTALTLLVRGREQAGGAGHTLNLPELRTLRIQGYGNRGVVLECPQLTSLTLANCVSMDYVCLQAPLKELLAASSGEFRMHDGFPLTNFLGLVSLEIQCDPEEEREFMEVLPQMEELQNLRLDIWDADLSPLSFPPRLCKVELRFLCRGEWDNSLIPLLQKLPELRDLTLELERDYEEHPLANLSCDLRPFLAMQNLRTFRLGPWQAWSPSTFMALGKFEEELVRFGSRLQLLY